MFATEVLKKILGAIFPEKSAINIDQKSYRFPMSQSGEILNWNFNDLFQFW